MVKKKYKNGNYIDEKQLLKDAIDQIIKGKCDIPLVDDEIRVD